MSTRVTWVGLFLGCVLGPTLVGCGDKDPEEETRDTGSDDPLDALPDGFCSQFVHAVYECYDVAGLDIAELGLTEDYCDAYDESDPEVAEYLECYVDRMAEIDCTDVDTVRHEIGIVPNRCGLG